MYGRAGVLFASLMMFASLAHAEEAAPSSAAQKIKVGIYILSIGKFEIATGSYTIDFYLNLESDQVIEPGGLEFSNGRATMELLQTTDGGKGLFYRVLATLNTNINLQQYPWDDQTLPIIIEHKTKPMNKLVLEVDAKQTGIDPEVQFVGWQLKGAEPLISTHRYDVYDETYSRYTLAVKIARLRLAATLKTFLPIGCFILITFISMLITVEKVDNRLAMAIGTLIASVMFHVSLASSIPPVGYLTLTDKVMVATYATIGANLLISVIVMRLVQTDRKPQALAILQRTYSLLPALAVAAFTIAVV